MSAPRLPGITSKDLAEPYPYFRCTGTLSQVDDTTPCDQRADNSDCLAMDPIANYRRPARYGSPWLRRAALGGAS